MRKRFGLLIMFGLTSLAFAATHVAAKFSLPSASLVLRTTPATSYPTGLEIVRKSPGALSEVEQFLRLENGCTLFWGIAGPALEEFASTYRLVVVDNRSGGSTSVRSFSPGEYRFEDGKFSVPNLDGAYMEQKIYAFRPLADAPYEAVVLLYNLSLSAKAESYFDSFVEVFLVDGARVVSQNSRVRVGFQDIYRGMCQEQVNYGFESSPFAVVSTKQDPLIPGNGCDFAILVKDMNGDGAQDLVIYQRFYCSSRKRGVVQPGQDCSRAASWGFCLTREVLLVQLFDLKTSRFLPPRELPGVEQIPRKWRKCGSEMNTGVMNRCIGDLLEAEKMVAKYECIGRGQPYTCAGYDLVLYSMFLF